MDTPFTVYLAPYNFTRELIDEITADILEVRGQLILVKGPPKHLSWAQNIWLNPLVIPITSITNGVKKLLSIQRNWCLHSENYHRRAKLIQDALPYLSKKSLYFGERSPQSTLGSWTLWERNTIIASPQCSSVFPNGLAVFHENKIEPPSRAYLKLWEVFTRFSITPEAGEVCLDLGAAPGGWTWALARLGTHVISIDKALLAPHISSLSNVTHYQHSAFGIHPSGLYPVDWLFSDIACYPSKLYTFIKPWLTSTSCHTIVCTIKLQGSPQHTQLSCFKEIPHSRLVHLSHNKHELTWVYSTKYPLHYM